MAPHEPADFLLKLAPHILAELKPPAGIKDFTTNPAIIGGYVEAGCASSFAGTWPRFEFAPGQ
jgi:hypothetical protein